MSASRLKSKIATTKSMYDPLLLGATILIMSLGFIMVMSASLHIAAESYGNPWFYATRQLLYIGLGLLLGVAVFRIPVAVMEKLGPWLLPAGILLLLLVLIPGIGRTVNGATRWLDLGVIKLQVSELMKLCVIIYLAGYLVRRGDEVRTTFKGFLKPMALISVAQPMLLIHLLRLKWAKSLPSLPVTPMT